MRDKLNIEKSVVLLEIVNIIILKILFHRYINIIHCHLQIFRIWYWYCSGFDKVRIFFAVVLWFTVANLIPAAAVNSISIYSVRVWVLSCASFIKPSNYPIFDFLSLFPGFLLLLSLRVTYIKQSKKRLVLNSNK